MAGSLRARTPEQESLLRAAAGLDQALAGGDATQVHRALRDGIVAVEGHLAGVTANAAAEELAAAEPRLIPALERLEVELARLLVEAWQARAGLGPSLDAATPALERIARQLRRAADEEFGLSFEGLEGTGTGD